MIVEKSNIEMYSGRDYPYKSCLCTFSPSHPYFILQFHCLLYLYNTIIMMYVIAHAMLHKDIIISRCVAGYEESDNFMSWELEPNAEFESGSGICTGETENSLPALVRQFRPFFICQGYYKPDY